MPIPFRSRALAALFSLAAAAPSGAGEISRTLEREHFRAAWTALEKGGDEWKPLAAGLENYPLYPYLGLALLKHRTKLERKDVEEFIARWPDSLPARDAREYWLRIAADRGDWAGFRALWADSRSADLKCDFQRARIAAGESPTYADIESVWLATSAQPPACDALFAWARTSGVLDDARVWQRLTAAAEAGNPNAAASIAALLPAESRAAAQRYADAVRDPAATLAKADAWPDEAHARDAISLGLARMARKDPDGAETLWTKLGARAHFDAAQKNRVLRALALYRASSYAPNALARLKALPADAQDDATREWRVRIALAAQDFPETLAALDALSAEQRADPRWRYLRARTLVKLDRKAEADPIFASVARESGFYGFLAADWLAEPYAICPRTLAADPKAERRIAADSNLARAFEWYALDLLPQARREWDFAYGRLDASDKRLAADLAFKRGWYDRAVFALSADPESQRLYEQRFPLALEPRVKRESKEAGIDPAWAYAIIRAESAWVTDARSGADAFGLMQLLAPVAKQLAAAEKLPYREARDLYQPELNIQLGTRYLARMASRYDGSPWLASAAYNAGEAPVRRWLDARSALEPDFFIETIPYRETREYVARVMAFSVIYDWRMHGKTQPLAARLPRIGKAYSAPGNDAPRKDAVCPIDAAPADVAPAAVAAPRPLAATSN